jgi:hypothetical protein
MGAPVRPIFLSTSPDIFEGLGMLVFLSIDSDEKEFEKK